MASMLFLNVQFMGGWREETLLHWSNNNADDKCPRKDYYYVNIDASIYLIFLFVFLFLNSSVFAGKLLSDLKVPLMEDKTNYFQSTNIWNYENIYSIIFSKYLSTYFQNLIVLFILQNVHKTKSFFRILGGFTLIMKAFVNN